MPGSLPPEVTVSNTRERLVVHTFRAPLAVTTSCEFPESRHAAHRTTSPLLSFLRPLAGSPVSGRPSAELCKGSSKDPNWKQSEILIQAPIAPTDTVFGRSVRRVNSYISRNTDEHVAYPGRR